jgi:hypothetical protein
MKIKKFNEYHLNLNEDYGSSQLSQGAMYGYSDLSTVNGGSVSPRDNDMALDAYDKFDNNLKYTMNRYIALSRSLFGDLDSHAYMKYTKSILNDITDVYIQNIVNNNDISLTIYIRFNVGDEQFHAKIENFQNETNWTINSNFLQISSIKTVNDVTIRFKQIIKNALDKFFEIDNGVYILNKEMSMYNTNGEMKTLDKGCEVEIINSFDKEISIMYNGVKYMLSGNTYYLFHYYFTKKKINTIKF